jgi:hypothetical protein
MPRSWPFEDVPEGGISPPSAGAPEDFLAVAGNTAVAVVVRIGLHDAQLVLVAESGYWNRWVYHSMEEAEEVARSLGVSVHVGEFPEEIRVVMNAYVRPREDFDRAAYPEQGGVGPVIPYPENRPRRIREGETQTPSGS